MAKLQEIAIETLIDRYEVLLLDAYGVRFIHPAPLREPPS